MPLRPYQLKKGIELLQVVPESKIDLQKEDISKFFTDNRYKRTEKRILIALYHYPFLTKNTLSRYLNITLGEHKMPEYRNILKTMWLDGAVERYDYGSTSLYHLSESAWEYIEGFIKNKNPKKYPSVSDSIGKILECASMAQWQISLISGKEKVNTTAFYEEMRVKGTNIFVESYAELIKNGRFYKVHSFCVPKNMGQAEVFSLNLENHIRVFLKHKEKPTTTRLFILVAEDIEQIEQIGTYLLEKNELKGANYYFVLDSDTNYTNGLEIVYSFTKENGESKLNTLEFFDFSETIGSGH